MGAIVTGIGKYYPDNIVTNADLEKRVDTTDEWISSRTGIKERRIVPEGENIKTSDLGVLAAKEALESSGLSIDQIDGIICASLNPDKKFPATACFIQQKLQGRGFAFDVTAACAGFVYAVNMASLMINDGQAKNVIVVGSELISRVLDWNDRNTCILFGDGAGAIVLSKSDDPKRGVLNSILDSDSSSTGILNLDYPSPENLNPGIQMEGKKVFKVATTTLVKIVEQSLAKEGLSTSDIGLAIFHQANVRILDAVAKKLNLSENQLFVNLHKYGNTSTASIPIALYEAEKAGRLKKGMLVLFAGIGGGMSWGCNLFRW